MDFNATHVVTIKHSNGQVERVEVDAGQEDLTYLPAGTGVALHTREEAEACGSADWEYTADEGLLFQGQAGAPWATATYSIHRV